MSPSSFQNRPSRAVAPGHLYGAPLPHSARPVQAAMGLLRRAASRSGRLPRRAGDTCRGGKRRVATGEERWGRGKNVLIEL
jgi:hypothetical protein